MFVLRKILVLLKKKEGYLFVINNEEFEKQFDN